MTNTKPSRRSILGVFMLAAVSQTPARAQTAAEVVLHSFGRTQAPGPNAAPILDSTGALYGTTAAGGPRYAGTIFALDASGSYRVLYSFTGGAGGSKPNGVSRDPQGNFYGTTMYGTTADETPGCITLSYSQGCGIAYKVDSSGRQTVLHRFTGGLDGGLPSANLVRDAAGNLYGTATIGGSDTQCTYGCGVVFKLDAAGNETILHNFTVGADGIAPGALIRDSAGNLYGTTSVGGPFGHGVIYKLGPSGQETLLYTFTGKADGSAPNGIVLDSAGNLYGTTYEGGKWGYGVVYKLDAAGRETVLYAFQGKTDGGYPLAGVIRDPAGDLFGTTSYGGDAAACYDGCGVVFKLDPSGHETVLRTFTGTDGWFPSGGLARDAAGNLYGNTADGGTSDGGVLFALDPAGHERVLHYFPNGSLGTYPSSGLIADPAGNLYGTASSGGPAGRGVVYRFSGPASYKVLYGFKGETDGYQPAGGVIRDSAGNLYGTAVYGGAAGGGEVYKVNPSGQKTELFGFTGAADGGNPSAGVIRDGAGNLYGTTLTGGAGSVACSLPNGCGVVFKLSPSGKETVLHAFTNGADGGSTASGVTRDPAGNLNGTAPQGGAANNGVVYKLDTAGNYTVLYSFTGGSDGGSPNGAVILDAAGNLYGTAPQGGIVTGPCQSSNGCGVVYKLDPAGHQTVLYTFTGGADGSQPYGGVLRDSAGNLYGNTYAGGAGKGGLGCGVVYKLDAAGNYSVLYTLTSGGANDGCSPGFGLLGDAVGNLFGTTHAGGTRNTGVVFKIAP